MTTPTEMSAEEMRIACAEAMNLVRIPVPKDQGWGEGMREKQWWYAHQLPNYPVCNNAALTLCDHLAGEGWRWQLNGNEEAVQCAFRRTTEVRNTPITREDYDGNLWIEHSHTAPTMAEAICGAFLKCKGLFQTQTKEQL